jgi:capsular polysaccharide biosynthesis protein
MMIDTAKELYNDGKKSLEMLLREKAYEEVSEILQSRGLNIEEISDADVEHLVAAKTDDMINAIKGFGVGTAFALAISLFLGA